MLPLIAVPLLHSSGAWIASTTAGGYIAGTLSSTWIGAFIAGNAGILSGLGITSAAGVLAAMGGGLSSVGAALGTGLSAVGLTGGAQSLGLAPVTFLGLTVVGWALAGTGLVAAGVSYFFMTKKMKEINQERTKGGLSEVTCADIIAEVRDYDKKAFVNILKKLEIEFKGEIVLDCQSEIVLIKNKAYKIDDIKYVIERNRKEYIGLRSNIPFRNVEIFVVKNKNK